MHLTRTSTFFSVLLVFLAIPTICKGDDVAILVHGLGGWGEDEFLGFPYWNYASELEAAGLTVKVAAVGKFTSNWDRAIELYAQIKGTVVDYGLCHSAQYGHLRLGKNYSGQALYPEWNENHRVHFIGHSMGPQTIRMLEILLHHGSGCTQQEESELLKTPATPRNWIKSITAISGTLDGTTFVGIMGDQFTEFVRDLVIAINVISRGNFVEDLYDVDMEQWGLVRGEDESFTDYWNRAYSMGVNSPDNEDFSMFDLSVPGARKINNMGAQTYAGTYYFALTTERTNPNRYCFLFICYTFETPDIKMIPFLWLSASIIGGSSNPKETQVNDGLVNQISQLCPTSDTYSKGSCVEYKGVWAPSKWHYLKISTLDHLQIILPNTLTDLFNYEDGPKKVYREHAQRIMALPKDDNLLSVVANEDSDLDDLFKSIQYMKELSGESKSDKSKQAGSIVLNVFIALALVSLFAYGGRRYYLKKIKLETTDIEEVDKVKKRSSVSHYIEEAETPTVVKKRESIIDSIRNSLRNSKPIQGVELPEDIVDNESGIISTVRKSLDHSTVAQISANTEKNSI